MNDADGNGVQRQSDARAQRFAQTSEARRLLHEKMRDARRVFGAEYDAWEDLEARMAGRARLQLMQADRCCCRKHTPHQLVCRLHDRGGAALGGRRGGLGVIYRSG